MLNVKIDPSAEDNGLAAMLVDLMQQNVAQHPQRQADFDALRGAVAIEAKDAEVALTLDFRGGELVVYGGVNGKPDVTISTDSGTVLDLSNAKLMLGLPDVTDATGRAVVKKMLSGELKLRGAGLLSKPMLLIRLTKLLSVYVEPVVGLPAGETIAYRANLHGLIFLWPALVTVAAAFAYLLGKRYVPEAIFLGIVAVLFWIANIRRKAMSEFVVTDRQVLLKSGLFGDRLLQIPLAEIEGVEVAPGIGGRLFGLGKIKLRRKSGATEAFGWLARPAEFAAKIKEQTAKTTM
jgi:hypothetical protein